MDKKPIHKTPSLSKHPIRRVARVLFIFSAFGCLVLLGADYYVESFSKGQIYSDSSKIPHRSAAVVLGCGKYTQGRPNLYYKYRINAAIELWNAGKIDAIVVSGDNSRKGYDEPSEMKADLVSRGIPGEYIAVDYAGFRTLDSIIRAKAIFDLQNYTVISQPFHCQRAVYLAGKTGQSAIGYCAADVGGSSGLKVRLREVLARAKAVADVIVSKNPKYLGKKERVFYRIRE
jgi:SanA protein